MRFRETDRNLLADAAGGSCYDGGDFAEAKRKVGQNACRRDAFQHGQFCNRSQQIRHLKRGFNGGKIRLYHLLPRRLDSMDFAMPAAPARTAMIALPMVALTP